MIISNNNSTLSRFAPTLPAAKRCKDNAKVYNSNELALILYSHTF